MKSPKPETGAGISLVLMLLAILGTELAFAEKPSGLSLAAVQPYSAEYEYFLGGEEGVPVMAGSWTDQVSVADGQLSRRVTRYTDDGAVDLLRTVVVDRDSIAPVRIQQRFGPELSNVYHLEFSGQVLTQILVGDATRPARVSTVELDDPVVETGLQAVFVLSLPMAGPGEVTVTTYAAGAEPKVVSKTFHITGQEKVEVMGQVLEAWRVEDHASQWSYWVRQKAPYILKVVHPAPGGKMATSLLTSFR